MKELKKVSRWITINDKRITRRHHLWEYGYNDDGDRTDEDKQRYIMSFKWHNREYSLEQFLSRFSVMVGFDHDCKEYPSYITGYDGENYFNPLYCELDEVNLKIRLYQK